MRVKNALAALAGSTLLIASPPISYAASWKCQFPIFKEPTIFIETSDSMGKIVANGGASDVAIIKAEKVLSFVELVGSGAVMTTTIYTPTGEAVHSRNTVITLAGDDHPFEVSQTMGKCTPMD